MHSELTQADTWEQQDKSEYFVEGWRKEVRGCLRTAVINRSAVTLSEALDGLNCGSSHGPGPSEVKWQSEEAALQQMETI